MAQHIPIDDIEEIGVRVTWDFGVITSRFNYAKEETVENLVAEGLISEEVGKEFCETHTFIIHKRGWFGELAEKIFGASAGGWEYKLVKILDPKKRKAPAEPQADSRFDNVE